MIRIVALAFCVLFAWVALLWLMRMARERTVDWTGVAFIAGFVALAFWLRGATGLG